MRKHCAGLIAVLGIRVVRDPYQMAGVERPTLYLSNHISYLDILVLGAQWELGFLAKFEVSTWPFVGFIARSCGTIFVKRNSLFSRAMCIEKIYARLESGQSMLVFPEGTTSIEGPLKRRRPFFHGSLSAAAWADADLKLLHLDYENVEEIAWLGDDSLVPNLWRLLGRRSTRVRIREEKHVLKAPHRAGDAKRYAISNRQMRMWMMESGLNTI